MTVPEVLRKAADLIENGNSYYWGFAHSCSCGILGLVASQMSSDEYKYKLYQELSTPDWSYILNRKHFVCQLTGLSLRPIIESPHHKGGGFLVQRQNLLTTSLLLVEVQSPQA